MITFRRGALWSAFWSFGRLPIFLALMACLHSAPVIDRGGVGGSARVGANPVRVVTVLADGTLLPSTLDIYDGDTVEWQFANRGRTIIPISVDSSGQPAPAIATPYVSTNANEFTGPMPRAASGIFTLSPEEAPYLTQDSTWKSTNFTGVFIRARWDEVHLGPGVFNWAAIDKEIGKAVANGKVYNLGFKAGSRGTPQWIFDSQMTASPVARLDFGFKEAGKTIYLGSPADANFRRHYFDLLRAAAAHLRERNDFYRALAYIKVSGLNLFTHENRLPNDTPADLKTWAGSGHFTPTALFNFYAEQTALMAAEFPDKDMSYALIQDGFPAINELGEFTGQAGPVTAPIPKSSDLTEAVLRQGRTNWFLRFAVQHNGLQTKPAFCPGNGTHPVTVDPKFTYVGSGCPNRWVLAESASGQVTGYQDVAGITNVIDLEATFQNEWDNSDGVFLEVYEAIGLFGEAQGLPSGLSIGRWSDRFHERRRTLFSALPDPFPLTHRHTFSLPGGVDGGGQSFFYYSGPVLSGSAPRVVGRITVQPLLKMVSVTSVANGSYQVSLNSGRSGELRLESSSDLLSWHTVATASVTAGVVSLNDPNPSGSGRFYRAHFL